MDQRERLRLRLAGAACPACGRRYRGTEVGILAQREALAFVRLLCGGCGTERLTLLTDAPGEGPVIDEAVDRRLTGGTAGGQAVSGGGPAATGRGWAAAGGPLQAEDVAAVHAFLAGYRGDLRGLLGRDRGSGPTGR